MSLESRLNQFCQRVIVETIEQETKFCLNAKGIT